MNIFLKTLFFAQSLNVFADHLLIPLFSIFVLSLGGNLETAGFLWSIQFATSAVVGFFVLKIKDGPSLDQRLVTINYLIKAIAWTLVLIYPTLTSVIIAQILIGMASAIGGPAFNALTSEHLDNQLHIREWGILQFIQSGITAIAVFISGLLVTNYGFSILFGLMATFEFVSFLIILRLQSRNTSPVKQ